MPGNSKVPLLRNVYVATVYWGFVNIPLFIIYTYFTIYLYNSGLEPSKIGLIFAFGSLANIIGYLVGGINTDLIGRRESMTIGTILVGVSIYFLPTLNEFFPILINYFVYMAGFSLFFVSLNTLLGDSLTSETYQKYSAIAYGVSKVPSIFAILVFIIFLNEYTLGYLLKVTLQFSAILVLISTLFVLLLKDVYKSEKQEKKIELKVLFSKERLLFIVYMALIYFAFPMFWVMLSVFATNDAGLNLIEWGLIALVWFTAYSPLQTLFSRIANNISSKKGFILSAVFFSINGFILIVSPNMLGFLVAIFFEVLAEAALWPIVFKVEMNLTEPHYRGTYIGLVNIFGAVAMFFGNYVGGTIYSIIVVLPIVFAVVVFVIGALCLAIKY